MSISRSEYVHRQLPPAQYTSCCPQHANHQALEAPASYSATLRSILYSTHSIYPILGHRYHTLPSSIQNNPLIPLRERALIALEFSSPEQSTIVPSHETPDQNLQTPIEETICRLRVCADVFDETIVSISVSGEVDMVAADAVLKRAKSLSGVAMVQLCDLWEAVRAHESLERWMASREIRVQPGRSIRSKMAAREWAVRVLLVGGS